MLIYRYSMPSYQSRIITIATRVLLLHWLFVTILILGSAFAHEAEITPSGLNTDVHIAVIHPAGTTQYNITGGTRPGDGHNLFHSFGKFDVPANHIANFLNETKLPTDNILARVTGGEISDIFGTIQTQDFGSAKLFLVNPAGFVFGPTATLNVNGSVAFTSADYIKLADNVLFNATLNTAADALLSTAAVASFGFLSSDSGAIKVLGSTLKVQDGQSIVLAGGNIEIQSDTPIAGTARPARLVAPNGTILLGSARSPGEFDSVTLDPLMNVKTIPFSTAGSIVLNANSSIDVRGEETVSIKGGQFVLTINDAVVTTKAGAVPAHTVSLSGDSVIATSSIRQTSGADINMIVGTLVMDSSHIKSSVAGTGAGGNIHIDVGIATLKEGASIRTNTLAPGNAGNVTMIAKESIGLVDSELNSSSFDIGNGAGEGGQLWLTAPAITLQGSRLISSSNGMRSAGEIRLEAQTLVVKANDVGNESSISANTLGRGMGGSITIRGMDGLRSRTTDVIVADASSITSTTSGDGDAGDIAILTERMFLANGGSLITSSISSGDAGTMLIDANHSVQVTAVSVIESTAEGIGSAGKISITTPTLTLKSGGQISTSTTSKGKAGAITIGSENASDLVLVEGDESGIFTDTTGTGIGGTIDLFTRSLLIQDHGTISAKTSGTTKSAAGGSISITATDQVKLTDRASIEAGTSGPGDAGDIVVNAKDVSITGGAKITAESTGSGRAGTITIQGFNSPANSFLLGGAGSSMSTSTSKNGVGGNILIHAKDIRLTHGGKVLADTSGATTAATGGTITMQGDRVRIENSSLVTSSTSGLAKGGTITVAARESVSINDGAAISASSTGLGDAGNISVHAGERFMMHDGSVTTSATQSVGGNIEINAIDLVSLVNGRISTSVLGGAGNGGNISIDPNMVVLQNNSQIVANALAGHGGNITIATPVFLADQSSLVDASSLFGINGTVTIQSPISNLSGTVGQLTSQPSPVHLFVQNRCVALANGQPSTLIVGGRQTFSTTPGGWASSPLLMAIGTGEPVGGRSEERTIGLPVASENEKLSLRRLTPPSFLVRSFANDVHTGCRL